MVKLLSLCRKLLSIVYLYASMKYLHTNSDSVELPTLSLFVCNTFTITPLPTDIIVPVWPFESQCTPYKLSTHLNTAPCEEQSTLQVLIHVYCLTLVVENDIVVCMSGQKLLHTCFEQILWPLSLF